MPGTSPASRSRRGSCRRRVARVVVTVGAAAVGLASPSGGPPLVALALVVLGDRLRLRPASRRGRRGRGCRSRWASRSCRCTAGSARPGRSRRGSRCSPDGGVLAGAALASPTPASTSMATGRRDVVRRRRARPRLGVVGRDRALVALALGRSSPPGRRGAAVGARSPSSSGGVAVGWGAASSAPIRRSRWRAWRLQAIGVGIVAVGWIAGAAR